MVHNNAVARNTNLRDSVWALWPWMNWGTPVAFLLSRFIGNGGWETLFLLFFSPLIVPAIALLASLPRFVLRRRRQSTAPGPIPALLFVHWWAWVAMALVLEGSGDSGSLPALLDSLVPEPIAPWFQRSILVVAALIAVLSWVAIVVCAGTLKATPRHDPWRLRSIIAAVVAPAVLIVAVLGGVTATTFRQDAAGETFEQVTALSPSEREDRAVQRYEDAQRTLSGVRALIADDGWGTDRVDAGGYAGACRSEVELCYHFQFSYFAEGSPDVMEELAEELRSAGWRVREDGTREGRRIVVAADASGNEVEVYRFGSSPIRVEFVTPAWWDGEERISTTFRDENIDFDARYAADEWPPAP